MKLLVGLGNPGRDFKNTRHNVGFMVLDFLSRKLGARFSERRCFSRLAFVCVEGEDVILAKPLTYMNLSGRAVLALIRKYNLPINEMMVIYDDIDLPFGQIRIRQSGGSGGHKGVESIILALNSKEFPRLRIGIGRPQNQGVVDYVLSPFPPDEKGILKKEVIPRAAEGLLCFINEGIEAAMNKFNRPF